MLSFTLRSQRAEHCFAAYNVRSVDKLSGRTTDWFGDIRPDTAHSIGGTKTTVVMTMGRSWSMGTPLHLPGPQDRQRERELRAGWSRVHRRGAAGAAGPSRDYGPAGSSGSRRRLRRGRTTLLGTTGRMERRRRTHYGPTWIRQAGFSLCHRRDGRAGTTILQVVSPDVRTKTEWLRAVPSDYGPTGLPDQGQRRRIRRRRRMVLRDYGPEEAASSSRRAVGTAGPYQGLRADREQRTPPTTRPRDLTGAGRRFSPMEWSPSICQVSLRAAHRTRPRPPATAGLAIRLKYAIRIDYGPDWTVGWFTLRLLPTGKMIDCKFYR